jgi:hypothetical protein
VLIVGGSDFDSERKNTCNHEDSESEVLKSLAEEFKESGGFSDGFLVGSVLGFSFLDL